ncbi:hypothetical protein CSQ96_27605 [Janthinobacterium sp. BJB412]|nr:hypothetical protein CSQ96_27605 [Janthinobacterium sp. BJB412]
MNTTFRTIDWINRVRRLSGGQPVWQVLGTLLISCCAAFSGVAHAAGCGPEPGGPPTSCAGSSVASTGGNGGPSAGAGNPINVITGNKYQREEDLPALPGVLGLEIVRHYNSAYSKPGSPNGPMGREWKLSYETELFDKNGRIQVLQADGGRIIFNRDPSNPSLCSTLLPANGRMTVLPRPNGAVEYTWTWTNGRRLHFNSAGKLERIVAPTGEEVDLYYRGDNTLAKVVDPQGRSLTLNYLDREHARANDRFRGVQYIDSPAGRFSYEYGSVLPKGRVQFDERNLLANMVRATLPSGYRPDQKTQPPGSQEAAGRSVSRVYHHEDPRFPWLLTGISVETAGADGKPVSTRFATFGYDGNARANLSTHANNVDKVTLDTREGGKTVLTNSLGQQTVYRYAIIGEQHRMLEVRGAGCSTCGETNVRYGYDRLGQLTETTKLDFNGAPISTTRSELDKLGRTVRVGKVDYQNGKPGAVQWLLRLEYLGDSGAPVVIARPSVVPGRELQTRITYNDSGQPLSETDIGWVPTYDGQQAAGALERTTTYRYAVINGRSLLTRVDGPLANGKTNSPLDSDVTVFEYDNVADADNGKKVAIAPRKLEKYDEHTQRRDGLLTRIIVPGNLTTEVLERDAALRPTKLRTTDGDLVQLATIRNNWRGAPEDLDLTAGTMRRHLHYDYNADGQIAAVTQPGNLRSLFQYDQAGRITRLVLPDGSGLAIARDTEDRTAGIARYGDMGPAAAEALASTRFDYDRAVDKPGRLTRIVDTLGLVKNYRYNDAGQVIAITNALGTTTALGYDAEGLLASRTDAAGSANAAALRLAYDKAGHATDIAAANGVKTLRRYDDFGHKVFEADPDRGVNLYRYDAAGRPVARIDETLATTRYTYDNAGRLLAVGKDKIANLLQYQYRGSKLASMLSTTDGNPAHTAERLDYQYDAMGQLIRETRWLANVGQKAGATRAGLAGLRFVTANEYDEAGRLVRQTLPDGHSVRYRFTPAGDAVRQKEDARYRPGQLEAILFDDHVVVDNIEQTIVGGMTGYTMGNGMRQQIQLDRRGRIEQLRTLSRSAASDASWWRRTMAWFSSDKEATNATLYSQHNRYDEAGRLVQVDHQVASMERDRPAAARREGYAYDRLDRLTGIVGNDGTDTYFGYDTVGNRIAESNSPAQAGVQRTGAQTADTGRREFHYANNSNWLLAATESSDGPVATARPLRDAWLYHPTGVPLAQLQRQGGGAASNRRTVYNSDKRPVAIYDNDRLVARYHYNTLGERIAKTVFPARPALTPIAFAREPADGATTYSLYRDQRLAAETDGLGHITAHYIYLYGKPVAKIEMEANTHITHRLLKAITMRSEDAPSDRLPRIYAIVTDHLGTPQQVVDEQRQLVWQALTAPFGLAHVTFAADGSNGKPFEMNLRLPGQVYDAETRLHYNYLRDYDPALGRYLTPDPMGQAGVNPYAYVSDNPLTNVDPLGLYQIDVHYYMTFFLAITAGVDKDTARRIALATQYIDENPVTEPMLPNGIHPGSLLVNQPALDRYHFVQDGYDPPRTIAESAYRFAIGVDLQSYMDRRIVNPGSPQLARLLNASNFAKTDPNANCHSSAQLFGEYLHALEDTFAHRDRFNNSYSSTTFGLGTGHLTGGENPDYTYNHDVIGLPGDGLWANNESRTLEMEKEVFAKLKTFSNPANHQESSLDTIAYTLKTFNATHAQFGSANFPEKIAILNSALKYLGYQGIDIAYGTGADAYNTSDARKNREDALNKLKPADYVGTILPQGAAPLPGAKK